MLQSPFRFLALALGLLSLALVSSPPPAAADAVVTPSEAGTVLPSGSDSAGPVAIGFPVNLGSEGRFPEGDFVTAFAPGDLVFSELYVNRDGSVSFSGPANQDANQDGESEVCWLAPIIAPYWSNVASATPPGTITYGQTTYDGQSAFFVTWDGVVGEGGHPALANSFQLLLVDRSVPMDTGTGDFDIIFNYDQIHWDCHLDPSGTCPGDTWNTPTAGFVFGGAFNEEIGGGGTQVFLPGSYNCRTGTGVPGALLDANPTTGLVHNHRNSGVPGRYIFGLRGGVLSGEGRISGYVVDESFVAVPDCVVTGRGLTMDGIEVAYTTVTDMWGNYDLAGIVEGDYTVIVSPPWDSPLFPAQETVLVLAPILDVDQGFMLSGPAPIPDAVTFSPVRAGSRGLPTVYWNDPLSLSVDGCPGGTATYSIVTEVGGPLGGTLTEDPIGSGTYTGVIPPLYPAHGYGSVTITIDCPDPDPDIVFEFDIYIDPSGTVIDGCTGEPIPGVTVTLFYTNDLALPFTPVPDGSVIMSPDNRRNPDVTDPMGMFRWDTLPGYYKVRAEKAGYVSALGDLYVETDILPVPPPQLGLELFLQTGPCSVGTTRAALQDQRDALAAIPDGKRIEKAVRALDKALADRNWQPDGEHLTKRGKKVLGEIKKALHELAKLDPVPAEVGAVMAELCGIVRTLARTEIDAAIARDGKAESIAKAEDAFQKAEDESLAGDCEKAVNGYRKAWEKAFKA